MSTAPQVSDPEARFDAARRRFGLLAAPLTFALLWWLPLPSLSLSAHRLAAVVATTVVLWVTEALPLGVTALLGPATAVLLGVATADVAFASFSDPLIYLFLGGFILAEGLSRQGVDRRLALWLIGHPIIAGSPVRALIGLCLIAFLFSMWISNTATTAMLLPVAIGIHATMGEAIATDASPDHLRSHARFGGGMCLGLAYAASIGGSATPVGTAPNVIVIGLLEKQVGIRFDFLSWMSFAVPIATAMLLVMLVVIVRRFKPPATRLEGLAAKIQVQREQLGPLDPRARRAIIIFVVAIAAWLAPSLLRLGLGADHPATLWARQAMNEGVVAILCASLLFVPATRDSQGQRQPLLTWEDARGLDWGTLLLLGGGLALGNLMFDTGLAEAVGRGVLDVAGPVAHHPIGIMLVSMALVLGLTEVTSNTAVTSMMLPVLLGLAKSAAIDPVPMAVIATIASSFAFMLPISTPPNAMVYGTRLVKIDAMVAAGVRLDMLGFVILAVAGIVLS